MSHTLLISIYNAFLFLIYNVLHVCVLKDYNCMQDWTVGCILWWKIGISTRMCKYTGYD